MPKHNTHSIHEYQGMHAEKMALTQLSQGWDFWAASSLLPLLDASLPAAGGPAVYRCFYTQAEDDSVSFQAVLCTQGLYEQVDVLYLYTAPGQRGQGLALKLLQHLQRLLLSTSAGQEPPSVHLEVRASNHAAICLYQKFGMQRSHIRRNYYQDGEDAWVFGKTLVLG